MPVKLRCSNPDCQRLLRIKDKYAGRRGRCPFCGTKVDVPDANGVLPRPIVRGAGVAVEDDEDEGFEVVDDDADDDEAGHTSTEPAPSTRRGDLEDEDGPYGARLIEEVDLPEEPPAARKKPPEKKPPQRPPQESADDSGDDSESGVSKARKPSRPRVVFAAPKRDINAVIMVGVGVFLLLFLGLTPTLDWFPVVGGGAPTGLSGTALLDGQLILWLSGATALGAVIAIGVSLLLSAKPANDLIAAAGCATGAWGSAAAIWLSGWIWKGFGTASALKGLLSRPSALTLPSAADNPFAGHVFAPDLSISVGPGLWVGVAAGVILTGMFIHLLVTRERGGAILVCPGVGVLAGIFVVVFHVRPWETFLVAK
jgi:hypothetical protein